ncbi:MAG TPA: hypothetical protein VNB91_09900 [Jatrophihabitantaceae bacterium]|nr:hypothetical protein [Jatrophihabitantaceae bacterium]
MAEILELGPDLGVELIVRLRHGLDHAPLPPAGDGEFALKLPIMAIRVPRRGRWWLF